MDAKKWKDRGNERLRIRRGEMFYVTSLGPDFNVNINKTGKKRRLNLERNKPTYNKNLTKRKPETEICGRQKSCEIGQES